MGRIRELLDGDSEETVGTSIRIPLALREAAALAVAELGAAASTTGLAVEALRSRLEAIVVEAALAAHYERHPGTAPSLAELAIAAAELDGNPLATQPRLIQDAAEAIIQRRPDADADDVLIWAEALSSSVA